ncbi:hypothetical protein [Acidithiobacillus sp.]|uniref:hypothetical protein n=1 Tax=Acidithiobacillus sp. TaxID=1872118 RepID=UPI0023157174|nr:hypothetical protein [Acidithiobacillus sp.]MDA8245481.1 hypothetical protein [Acidithiobacillus sp.]
MTKSELHQAHLVDVFEALKDAQIALDAGDTEELALCLAGAGFSLCCAMPEQYTELAPDAWYEKGC